MTTVTRVHQILVQAPLHRVFDYVSDLTRHPEWSSGQLRIEEVRSGPIEVGKEYLSYGEFAAQKRRRNAVRVIEYEPPYTFGFSARDPGVGNVSHVFTFMEEDGGVLVRRTMSLSLHPVLAFLFDFVVYPWTGSRAMDGSLKLLKARLENE